MDFKLIIIVLFLHGILASMADSEYPRVYWRVANNIMYIQCQGLQESNLSITRVIDATALLPGQNQNIIRNKTLINIYINLEVTPSVQGLYECNQTINEKTTSLKFILPNHKSGVIQSQKDVIRANIGEMIEIRMFKSPQYLNGSFDIKWRFNGKAFLQLTNDPLVLVFNQLEKKDAGVYECFVDNIEKPHGLTVLIVQDCPINKYGSGCFNDCPICFNGGICDSVTGMCKCPLGFHGITCEIVSYFKLENNICIEDGDSIYQPFDYSYLQDCNIHGFCLGEPYGCSFAAGSGRTINHLLEGYRNCSLGTFGVDCSQICTCSKPQDCDVILGVCKTCQKEVSNTMCLIENIKNQLTAIVSIYDYYRIITCSTNSGYPENIVFNEISSNKDYAYDEYILKNSKIILLNRKPSDEFEASYYCEEIVDNIKTKVSIRLNAKPEGRMKTVSALNGSSVILKPFSTEKVQETSNYKLIPLITISEIYSVGYDDKREHYFVSVSNCPAGQTGNNCSEILPKCQNGGFYKENIGCLCQPGFVGKFCEQICSIPSYITDPILRHCQIPSNRKSFVCLPDPIGCTCFSGTNGYGFCDEDCLPGTFGSECSLTCHCKNNKCKPQGFCEDGCEPGYSGDLCQHKLEAATVSSMSLELILGIAFACFILFVVLTAIILFILWLKRNKFGKKNFLRPLTLYIRKSEQWSLYSSFIYMGEENSHSDFKEPQVSLNSESSGRQSSTRSSTSPIYFIDPKSTTRSNPDSILDQNRCLKIKSEPMLNVFDYNNTLLKTIRWEDVALENLMGRGHFGEVYRGRMTIGENVTQIALKTLRGSATIDEWQQFKKEVDIMLKLGQHPNVLPLLGICRHKDRLFIVTEFLHNGDLRSLLRTSRVLEINPEYALKMSTVTFLNQQELLHYTLDVARGMEYLTSRQVLHRDLAARNVLIGENKCAKIADFGLARLGCQYVKIPSNPLPMRWMAIESLTSNTYTVKSDVWSFGIFLWEVATLGATPYPAMTIHNLLVILKNGDRLKKPKISDRKLYKIMTDCWKQNPKERPDFGNLAIAIQKLLISEKEHLKLKLTEDFEYEPVDFSVEAM